MLSHAVMRVVQVFLSFVMLSLACVLVREGLPSVEMWFEQGWNGGDGWIPSGDVACHARIC
jgi:hypothetical protein